MFQVCYNKASISYSNKGFNFASTRLLKAVITKGQQFFSNICYKMSSSVGLQIRLQVFLKTASKTRLQRRM